MALSRRGFLAALPAILAGATLDPDLLLWRPGAKTIFLPSPRPVTTITVGGHGFKKGDIFTISGCYITNTSHLQQFVVVGDVSGDGLTIPIEYAKPIKARFEAALVAPCEA